MHVHEICKTGGTLGAPFGFSTGAVNGAFVPCHMDRAKNIETHGASQRKGGTKMESFSTAIRGPYSGRRRDDDLAVNSLVGSNGIEPIFSCFISES